MNILRNADELMNIIGTLKSLIFSGCYIKPDSIISHNIAQRLLMASLFRFWLKYSLFIDKEFCSSSLGRLALVPNNLFSDDYVISITKYELRKRADEEKWSTVSKVTRKWNIITGRFLKIQVREYRLFCADWNSIMTWTELDLSTYTIYNPIVLKLDYLHNNWPRLYRCRDLRNITQQPTEFILRASFIQILKGITRLSSDTAALRRQGWATLP